MSDTKRTLLVVSGGAEAVPGILLARDLGLHVVVSDGSPHAPGFAVADDRLLASTYDVAATVREAERYHRSVRPLDGVLCISADVPLTVASVAAALALPGIPVETARLASDKLAMKERFRERGIATAWFAPVADAEALRAVVRERGLPLVVKPVDSRGARGVQRLTAGVDLDAAFAEALGQSPSGRVMVESYLAGPQVSTEAVVLEDGAATPGFADRNYSYLERFAPHVIEDGGDQPSQLAPSEQAALAALAIAAGRALGVVRGIVKGDMVLTPDGPRVIEVATRLSGGWFSSDQIPLATGVRLVELAIRLALGDPVTVADATPRSANGVAIRYFFPPSGRVRRLPDVVRLRALPGVHRLELFVTEGETLAPVTNHTKRAGCVITVGETRAEAVARAEEVVAAARFEVD